MPLIFNQPKTKNIYSRIDNPPFFSKGECKRDLKKLQKIKSRTIFLYPEGEEKRGEIFFLQGKGKRIKALSHRGKGWSSPIYSDYGCKIR